MSMDQALFQPFPSEVVFQQFQPHQTYEFPLNLRNNDRVRDSTPSYSLYDVQHIQCVGVLILHVFAGKYIARQQIICIRVTCMQVNP